MGYIDLHVHSDKSDGTMTPSQVAAYAAQKGLTAFALTDHDTVSGVAEAASAAVDLGIRLVPGIECSTDYMGKDIHIVGLFIDPGDKALLQRLEMLAEVRLKRNHEMLKKLNEKGISITLEQVAERFQKSILTRAHFARYLAEEGYTSSMADAFDRYLGDHACCFVKKAQQPPRAAIEMLHQAGGVAVLAHPMLYRFSDQNLDLLVRHLKAHGLDAIEAIYSTHSLAEERKVRALAKRYHLALSGGSDFHGANKKGIDLGCGKGHLRVPEELLTKLEKLKYFPLGLDK